MKLIGYTDLVEMGVVRSRMTLKRLIDSHGFPEGRLTTPNCRKWEEKEVEAWVKARPSARRPSPKSPHVNAEVE